MPGLRSAALAVYVAAGSRHEREENNGVAHFLEHMVFKGTQKRNAVQIAEEIEDVGGYINACTSRETTAYLARILAEDVPLAIEVIADIMTRSTLKHSEMELERNVILQEIAEMEDSAEDSVFEALMRTAYPEQPYGRSISGTAERVSQLSRKDLTDFIDEQYCPRRMILAAAGAVDHQHLTDLAKQHFGALARRSPSHTVPAKFSRGEARNHRKDEQVQFALAFEGPSILDPHFATARIHAMILGGGASSRLFVEAREKRGLCYAVSSMAISGTDSGALIVHAGTGSDQIAELLALCIDEIKLLAEDVSLTEIERAKAIVRSGLIMGLESPSNRVERIATSLLLRGSIESIDETLSRFEDVSIDDLRGYAERFVNSPAIAMALRGPIDPAPSATVLEARLAA